MGIFRRLVEEHAYTAKLVKRITSSAARRPAWWRALRDHLSAHETAEVEMLRKLGAAVVDPGWHDEEADYLSRVIGLLDVTPISTPAWSRTFAVLAKTAALHVRHEEAVIFPASQDAIGESRALRLEANHQRAIRVVAARMGAPMIGRR